MQVEHLIFTAHAVRQMFSREIRTQAVREVIRSGTPVAEYSEDRPHPSCLLLGFIEKRALHVVLAVDESTLTGYVITAYWPDPDLWTADFKTRKAR